MVSGHQIIAVYEKKKKERTNPYFKMWEDKITVHFCKRNNIFWIS